MRVSNPDEDNIEIIVNACLKDRALLEITESLARFTEEEKRTFEKKMKLYFFDKTSPEHMEAMKFFEILLEGENARVVLERIRGEER